MGTEAGGVPAIDIGELKMDGVEELGRLREASERWGCFRVVNHEIPAELMAEMKVVVRSLLDLPTEIKKRNTDVIAGSGYMVPTEKNPLYEALGLYNMGSPQAVHQFCSQLNASSHQREVIDKYARSIHGLLMFISEKLAESLGSDRNAFKDWPCQFRINKYNFTPETVGSSGVQIHTDSGFLTILQDDENVGGLEVLDGQSNTFIPVDPWPDTFLINLGDVARAWSNGRWCNVLHRVQCKQSAIRVSIATFLLGPKEDPIEPPSHLVDAHHPRLFLPFTYEDYRKLRLSSKLQAGEALAHLKHKSSS